MVRVPGYHQCLVAASLSYREGLSHAAEVGVGLVSEGVRRGLGMQVQRGCSARCSHPGARLFVRLSSRVVWWPRRQS